MSSRKPPDRIPRSPDYGAPPDGGQTPSHPGTPSAPQAEATEPTRPPFASSESALQTTPRQNIFEPNPSAHRRRKEVSR